MVEKCDTCNRERGEELEKCSGVVPRLKERGATVNQIKYDDHLRVLKNGKDVPEEVPSFQIKLNEVGITGKIVWVKLPEGRFPFEAQISVSLLPHVRGIHMSRIETIISNLYNQQFADLRNYAQTLASLVLDCQQGDMSRVFVKGRIPYIKKTSVSERISVDNIEILAEVVTVRDSGGQKALKECLIGVGVTHITACPCTQVYNQDLIQKHISHDLPLPTHSQRSLTYLIVQSTDNKPQYEELLDTMSSVLHLTSDLLKRPDEAEIVLKAHRYPQFVEDTAREVAKEVGLRFHASLPPQTKIIIDSLSFESIHSRDVKCRLVTTLGEITERLQLQID